MSCSVGAVSGQGVALGLLQAEEEQRLLALTEHSQATMADELDRFEERLTRMGLGPRFAPTPTRPRSGVPYRRRLCSGTHRGHVAPPRHCLPVGF